MLLTYGQCSELDYGAKWSIPTVNFWFIDSQSFHLWQTFYSLYRILIAGILGIEVG